MYGLIAMSVLVWAVLFGLGLTLWWLVSRPGVVAGERRRPVDKRARSGEDQRRV